MLRRLLFDLWYLFHPPWDSGISPPELMDFLAVHPSGRAIDLGCGTGTNVVTLARHGWQVTGIDFSPRAIRIASRKVDKAGVSAVLLVGDVTRCHEFLGPFDLALDLGCFHGLSNQREYLSHLERLLAPGGYWLMYGFFKAFNGPGPGLDEESLKLIQSSGFILSSKQDSTDKWNRHSVWLLYQAPNTTE